MKQFFHQNGIWILCIAALLGIITAVSSYALGGFANPFSNLINVAVTPVRNGFTAVTNWAEGIYSYSFEYDALVEENQQLKQENAKLQAEMRESEADSKENQRLRELLGLANKRNDLVFESATITARGSSNWASTLTLSKGTSQDVAVGDCVIDSQGNLVGIIDEVGTNFSTLITVIDANLELGGFLPRTDSTALLQGDFTLMGEGKLTLAFLPDSTQLLTGDLVLTSGMTGRYPPDLLVGTIQSLHTDPSGMTQYATVIPSVDFDDLTQVFIIKDFDIVE